jgi:apolipoprotein D and lipocalin family protein
MVPLLTLLLAGAPSTVASLDLHRYMGRWYEVARLPNRYQTHCAGDVIADYSLRPGGKITLQNQCRTATGKIDVSHAVGHVVKPAQLKVVFLWPFQVDYWVIDLDPDYRWAVVADPDRSKLWILSRTPQLDPETYQAILRRAALNGFEASRIAPTPQSVVH